MTEEELFFKIESYLKGELEAKDKIAFEEEINKDSNLAAQVEEQRADLPIMELLLEKDLRKKIQNWDLEMDRSTADSELSIDKSPSKKISKWLLGVLFILFSIGVFFIFKKSPFSSEQEPSIDSIEKNKSLKNQSDNPTNDINAKDTLRIPEIPQQKTPIKKDKPIPQKQYFAQVKVYSKQSKPEFAYPDNLTRRGNQSMVTEFENGINLLVEGSSKEALEVLTSDITMDSIFGIKFQNNLAYAYFYNDDFSKAVTLFQSLADDDSYIFSETCQWFLILSYLQMDKEKEAKEYLNLILQDKQHKFFLEAKKIMEML